MITYFPYPQVQIQWDSQEKGFTITLPWISIDVEVEAEEQPWIKQAIALLHTEPEHFMVQKFLSLLNEHPIAYYKPRSSIEFAPTMEPHSLLSTIPMATPQDLLHWIDDRTVLGKEFQKLTSWQWDMEEIAKITKIPGTSFHDPMSLITYLRGHSMAMDAEGGVYREQLAVLLDKLRCQNEPAFFAFMTTLIRQTHYITQNFQRYCPISLTTFQEATAEIQEFIQEEKGHDKLMEVSLARLGCMDPEKITPLPETIYLMTIFKKTAELCPMAFTGLVGFFEGGEYGLSDPLADILRQSSKPEAALGYERHFEINTSSNHNQVIYSLASKLPSQTYDQLVFTTRILEVIAHIGKTSDQVYKSQVQQLLAA